MQAVEIEFENERVSVCELEIDKEGEIKRERGCVFVCEMERDTDSFCVRWRERVYM